MRVVLNIAEKPSVAKHLAQALSRSYQKEKSFSKYNPIYTFQGEFLQTDSLIKVTSVSGHVKQLGFMDHKNWDSCNPKILLQQAQVYSYTNDNSKFIEKNIKFLSKNCTDLFLWLDCDREGEAIAYEIIEICQNQN